MRGIVLFRGGDQAREGRIDTLGRNASNLRTRIAAGGMPQVVCLLFELPRIDQGLHLLQECCLR